MGTATLLCVSVCPPDPSPVPVSPQASWRLPGRYVVMLRAGSEAELRGTARRLQARAARRGHRAELLHVFHLLPAFLVRMSSNILDTVSGVQDRVVAGDSSCGGHWWEWQPQPRGETGALCPPRRR